MLQSALKFYHLEHKRSTCIKENMLHRRCLRPAVLTPQ